MRGRGIVGEKVYKEVYEQGGEGGGGAPGSKCGKRKIYNINLTP